MSTSSSSTSTKDLSGKYCEIFFRIVSMLAKFKYVGGNQALIWLRASNLNLSEKCFSVELFFNSLTLHSR